MKLRRSLTLAAATAAIAPAVLLAAPIAYASDGDSPAPTTSETTPASDGSTPTADETTPAADGTTPAAQESIPVSDESTPAASQPSSPSASASASAAVSAPPSVSASASTGPVECNGDEVKTDKNLHTSLSGLPSKIVAGSGFHGFELNVNNTGDRAYQRVDLGVFAAQVDEKDYFVDTSHLTLQYKDPSSGKWVNISLDENDEGAGYLGYTDVKAHESFTIDLRLAVDKTAPAGLGYAISIGMYADDKGNCVFSGDDSYYEFGILKAGTAPGTPGDAKPQGGKKPLPKHQPTGNNKIEPQGHLAQTGSSSMLPAIALAGGAAVAVGAGAVFIVRRRKTAGAGTAG
ncbi:LPXTG cell wall anchor domain-containing protein [Streptomyces misionensis]|uniref:LPXTG cell wall anchor domain-containing protein n=1 Tax=Streptomyces misionensis TaxID=67331 RepID=A0A5C6IVT6_9ACTN|nr:LAETG motif-containing sortase-dependent surface protein [Streptomyces misionensis]TWV33126.1 LPXTG cell wall anchor domain-containing protein [Streptomyces misionensis]